VKKNLFICPKCGSEKVTYKKIYEIHKDLNTSEVLFDGTLTSDYSVKCRICDYETEDLSELNEEQVVIDNQGNVIWRKGNIQIPITPEYEELVDLELRLREIITADLEKVFGGNWLNSQIFPDILENATEHKEKQEQGWASVEKKGLPLVHYFDFSDYTRIITRRDNWEKVFKARYKDKEKVSVLLNDLNKLRNEIAHGRELTKKERTRFRYLVDELKGVLS